MNLIVRVSIHFKPYPLPNPTFTQLVNPFHALLFRHKILRCVVFVCFPSTSFNFFVSIINFHIYLLRNYETFLLREYGWCFLLKSLSYKSEKRAVIRKILKKPNKPPTKKKPTCRWVF